jgi:septal ring factor EnvC (AmiA/AmiB activator)
MVAKPTDESAAQHKAIIVLGMHRSGTSAMSGVLHILGVDLGPKLMQPAPDNPKGFWEHDEIVAIHDRLLAALNLSWNDLDPFPDKWWKAKSVTPFRKELVEILQRDFHESELWGLKDPRMCRLMPLWLDIFSEIKCQPYFVHVVRNPIEVAESLRKRNGFSRRKSILLWMVHELEAEQWTREHPRVFISFRQLLENWPGTLEKISEGLGIKFPKKISDVVDKVSDFLDLELKHHNRAEDLWNYDPDTPQCVLKAYADFESASDGQDANFVASLSECRAEFEASMQAYPSAAMMEELRQQREKWQIERAGLAGRIQSLSGEISARDTRITDLEGALRAKEEEKQGLVQRAKELEATVQERDARLAQVSAERDVAMAEIAVRDGRIAELEQTVSAGETRIAESVKELAEKDDRLAELTNALGDSESRIAQLTDACNNLEAQLVEASARIESLTDELTARDGQLSELQQQVLTKDSRLAEISNELQEKHALLAEASTALQEKEQRLSEAAERIEALAAEVVAREARITDLEAAIQAKEAKNQELLQWIEELNKLVQERDAQLVESSGRIEALSKELAVRDGRNAELMTAVEQREAELTHAHEALQDREMRLTQASAERDAAHREVAERDARIAELEHAIAARESRLVELANALNESEERLMEVRDALISEHLRELQKRENDIAEKEAQLKALDFQLESVYRSTSWRLSYPIRAIGALFRSSRTYG